MHSRHASVHYCYLCTLDWIHSVEPDSEETLLSTLNAPRVRSAFMLHAPLEYLPSGHQMVVVVDLDEGLDLGSLLQLLLAHVLCHFAWVALNASHQSMTKGFVRRTIIIVLQRTNIVLIA